jgi:MFS family permease
MLANTSDLDYKDRSTVLAVMGALMLLAGVAIGFLAPLEIYCFYLFSEGGRFHYAGFGFGSFMFANIASQIIGYYLIAALLIPLGYGHLKMRRWIRTLSITLLWFWLVVGLPIIIVVFFILVASKDLSLPAVLMALVLLGLSYCLFPALLIRFYRGRNVRRTLESKDARSYWIEEVPVPVLILSSLYLFYVIMLHILILFNGMYPLFGRFVYGFQGILLLDVSVVCLVGLTWGTLRQRPWAWWGAVILLGLFTFSTILTLFGSDYASILSGLAFPAREIEILDGLPVQGYHLAILAGLPLLITWGIAVLSKRHFRAGDPTVAVQVHGD